MSIVHLVSKAGQNCRTILVTHKEEGGLVKTKEVEPYVYRNKDGDDFFYCYDIKQETTRVFQVASIISVEETNNVFHPRYPRNFHSQAL